MKLVKLRAGLYDTEDGCFTFERMDWRAERYPGDLDYNQWVVRNNTTREKWLATFHTLKQATNAALGAEYGMYTETE